MEHDWYSLNSFSLVVYIVGRIPFIPFRLLLNNTVCVIYVCTYAGIQFVEKLYNYAASFG